MDNAKEPDAEDILLQLKSDERDVTRTRGRLKIFLGAAAGVGKTYRMLSQANQLQRAGVNLAVGIAETHGRVETKVLLEGLEVIGRRADSYGGATFEEMDLDAVLERRPRLALVDELAHTNVPGTKHVKRYQDVEEILEAGIDVFTTLNVQHIESLNDVVQQITSVRVGETLPDRWVEEADEVELVDITPEELLKRFREGKVYVPEKAEQAMRRFFRKGNIFALRELALRYTAQHIKGDMRPYTESATMKRPSPVGSRLAVCITPSRTSERLVRVAHGLASALDAQWTAIYVESPKEEDSTDKALEQLARNMWLVEELGGRISVLYSAAGTHLAQSVLEFARDNDVDMIIAGAPDQPKWKRMFGVSFVDELTHQSGTMHVLVVGSDKEQGAAGRKG